MPAFAGMCVDRPLRPSRARRGSRRGRHAPTKKGTVESRMQWRSSGNAGCERESMRRTGVARLRSLSSAAFRACRAYDRGLMRPDHFRSRGPHALSLAWEDGATATEGARIGAALLPPARGKAGMGVRCMRWHAEHDRTPTLALPLERGMNRWRAGRAFAAPSRRCGAAGRRLQRCGQLPHARCRVPRETRPGTASHSPRGLQSSQPGRGRYVTGGTCVFRNNPWVVIAAVLSPSYSRYRYNTGRLCSDR